MGARIFKLEIKIPNKDSKEIFSVSKRRKFKAILKFILLPFLDRLIK